MYMCRYMHVYVYIYTHIFLLIYNVQITYFIKVNEVSPLLSIICPSTCPAILPIGPYSRTIHLALLLEG